MFWKDKNNKIIREGNVLERNIPDEMEVSGFLTDKITVKYCNGTKEIGWYSINENRVIPFREIYKNNSVNDCHIIK